MAELIVARFKNPGPPKGVKMPKLTRVEREQIVAEWQAGASIRAIAKKHNRVWITIRRALEKAQLKVRKHSSDRTVPCADCSQPVKIASNGRFSSRCSGCRPAWKNKCRVQWERKRRIGLRPEEYDEMARRQQGKCAICGSSAIPRPKRGLFADHNHETGQVRGLLCHLCNVGLGAFKDDVFVLRKAIKYLQHYALSASKGDGVSE